MTRKSLLRLGKAFIVSAIFMYVLLRAPYLYAQVRYFFRDPAQSIHPTRWQVAVTPVQLPVSKHDGSAQPSQRVTNSARIRIQKIGVDVPIVFGIDGNDFKAMYDHLNQGVVHYAATPKPGLSGTAMIIGHSSDYLWKRNPYASVFALINKLAPGDVITVTYSDGQSYTFTVRQSLIYDPKNDDVSKFSSLENTPTPSLLLITCWPVNSTAKRYMVQAVLE